MARRAFGVMAAAGGLCLGAACATGTENQLRTFASPGLSTAIETPAAPPAPASEPLKVTQALPAEKPAAVRPAPALVPPTPPPPSPTASWPKTLPEARAEAEAKANPASVASTWTPAEVETAKARCTALLKGLDVVAIPEPGVRSGDCGAPAPVRLVSIGRNPEVALSPPPLVTCDMAAALHTWLKTELQPLAKRHLGSQVIKIETMSDYSCRNAYGRVKSKLSEHGRANALDIRGFVTAKGETTALLEHWGPTERDIAAQVAAAKAEAERAARERAVAAQAAAAQQAAAKTRGGQPAPAGAPSSPALRDGGTTLVEGLPKVTVPGIAAGTNREEAVFGVAPNRLGGPKVPADGKSAAPAVPARPGFTAKAPVVQPVVDPVAGKSRFLRAAHVGACKIFGTTLGPEANNAHRNHFHVDMAERARSNFCE